MAQEEQQAGAEAPEQPAGASESAPEPNEGSREQQGEASGNTEQGGSLTPESQAVVNKAIGRQHAKFREEQQRADGLEAEVNRLRALTPEQQRPDIPPLPDALDDDYEALMAARDTAIREAATFDARQEQATATAAAAASEAHNTQQAELGQSAQTYMERAKTAGLDGAELQVAGQTVAAYGISDELAVHILNDAQGPMITRFLAGNLNELESLRQMAPMQAAVHLATNIVPRLKAVPTNTGAPPPSDGLSGGGVPPSDRGPEGCTYS